MSKEIAEEYASSLADLTVNSKPLINMLTILAEENIDHAGVIVDTVEKHLEKVNPDIKLPVLYLVDSIIKNVGGAYSQKFSECIVNMFTKTFKQVDEKTRSQMFKLRETWHEVFPAKKLYQLDVKVNLLDPAWPIQSQPPQTNVHLNPNFLKKPMATPSAPSLPKITTEEEESMRRVLARKEQELLMLQKKKIEMELEQTRRQLEIAEKTVKIPENPKAVQPPVLSPAVASHPTHETPPVTVKQRLGPPVNINKGATSRIGPVSGVMMSAVNARRDPRLARLQNNATVTPIANPPIASNVFDIKPLDRVTKRKNVITIDVRANESENGPRERRTRDPRLEKSRKHREEDRRSDREKSRNKTNERGRVSSENKRRDDERTNTSNLYDPNYNNSDDKDKKTKTHKTITEPIDGNEFDITSPTKMAKNTVDDILSHFPIADVKKINKLPPIPKLVKNNDDSGTKNRKSDETIPSPIKKRKGNVLIREKKFKRRNEKERSNSSSPDKKYKGFSKQKPKELEQMDVDQGGKEIVAFKELKNFHKERYMRRNRQNSDSPDNIVQDKERVGSVTADVVESNVPQVVVENKDVDLRMLPPVEKPANIAQKRLSTETLESKSSKKSKLDKFDILFGNEDVDLRQLPQVEDVPTTQIEEDSLIVNKDKSPLVSPKQKDWTDIKEKTISPDNTHVPSQLDLVRAKLAEATKTKDRLGRQLLYSSSPADKQRRRTISTEDTDERLNNLGTDNDKESIKIIMSQAEAEFKEGNINKEQYNTLMFQVMQINEKLKLKEAKQRESLEESKRKLHKAQKGENDLHVSPKLSPNQDFGDIDERVVLGPTPNRPPLNLPGHQENQMQDSDLRVSMHHMKPMPQPGLLEHPRPFVGGIDHQNMGPFNPMWAGPRPREEFGPRSRLRGPGQFFRGRGPRPRLPLPPQQPSPGNYQGESPFPTYTRSQSPPPPLGSPGKYIPPTDIKYLEFIDKDPMKTIEIDGYPREIRFYGEVGIIMLDWDDPREIRFLPATRRITFDNKDSIVLHLNEDYVTAEIDDQEFNIRFGAPTRELYINNRWYECFFGGPPARILIDGVQRLVLLEGPPPTVDIRKEKRIDLVAGKISLIVDGQHMFPIFLDAKPQKFSVNGIFLTLRFVDSFKTVLINEVPFKVEFGGLPKPIFVGKTKHFIRFSILPRFVRPGQITIAGMEGEVEGIKELEEHVEPNLMDTEIMEIPKPDKAPSPEAENSNQGGLDILASMMPTTMAPASEFSGYSLGAALLSSHPDKIPGLDTPADEQAPPVQSVSFFNNLNVNDLFEKLVATGIVQQPTTEVAKDVSVEHKKEVEEIKKPIKYDRNVVKEVDLLKPETLRVKQPGIVARLYGGMQCSGCGARFPPEHTVRYSQHLDWHFRQNRRERESARRAHSRHWHYDLSDWVQYEEIEDLEEREKSWFETGGLTAGAPEAEAPVETHETPSVAAGAPAEAKCALCGDSFQQFYNEDKEEWHLRCAVKHDGNNYHPLCFEDLKASETKEEEILEVNDSVAEESAEMTTDIKADEPIEIKDVDDLLSQSDNESVIEVIESESKEEYQTLEIADEGDDEISGENSNKISVEDETINDDGDEDDVVLKADPVEQVVVEDDADTDDETSAARSERDRLASIDFSNVKVKQEPIDPDDEPVITAEEQAMRANPDTTHTTVLSSIDGNVQLDTAGPTTNIPLGGIRINITKTIPSISKEPSDLLDDVSADDEPLPPGEEPELEFTLKPALEGLSLSRQPPVSRGNELSGLCSIM